MKNPKDPPSQQQSQQLSPTLMSPLNQLIPYNRSNFISLSINLLKSPLDIEVRKIVNKTSPKGQQLLLIVLNNHVKAFVDMGLNDGVGSTLSSNRRSFNEKNSTIMYDELGTEFFQSDQQLHKLVVINPDLSKAQGAIELSIKYYTNRNYRHRSNKIIESRVRLLQLILSLLRSATDSNSSNHIPPLPELGIHKKNTSFKQLQVSHVRLIVEQLDQKVYQLSTISEQIPQLETFKRTLDLTMPQHNAYLTKIVDVLIELHHKVNKLISRRPEKLLKEIQAVESQCLIIQTATSQFLAKLETESFDSKLKPIYFDQKVNKSPDYFRRIQKNVVKLSEFVIGCAGLETQARQKISQIKSLIEVFWNLIAGMQQYQRQWKMYKNRQSKSSDQQQIIELLQLCLKFINDRIQKMTQQFQFQRQSLISENTKNLQYLQQDINRMSRENDEQRAIIEQLEKENEQLREDFALFDGKFGELNRKYQRQGQDYQAKIGMLEKREKNYRDKIQSLESENQQKKVMIANITNDLKRVMKESENTWKMDQKNKDLQALVQQLNPKIEQLQLSLKSQKQLQLLLNRQKQQIERNTQLVIKKLDQANRRVNDLQNELDDLKHRHDRQKSRLRQQIQDLEKRNNKLHQDVTNNLEVRTRDLERKEVEQKQIILKKDQKISELSDKIIDLNNKLSQIVNNYKNMQFQLKRKQSNLAQISTKMHQLQKSTSSQHEDLHKNYLKSQKQLQTALSQIQRCRNITVPQLQKQIKRRQEIIAQMQKIITELEDKQSSIVVQGETSTLTLRRIVGDLEEQLRGKEEELLRRARDSQGLIRDKDARIRELDHKISQLESQLRVATDDKNKVRQLDLQLSKLRNDYQKKLSQKQRENTKLKHLQSQKQKQLSRIRQSQLDRQRQLSKLKQTESDRQRQLNNRIRQLESDRERELAKIRHLEDRDRELGRIKQVQGDKDRELGRLRAGEVEKDREIARLRQVQADKDRQISRLRQAEQAKTEQGTKIKSLENQLHDKNKQIIDMQKKLSSMQNSLKDQQRQRQNFKNLLQDLKRKQAQISTLKQQNSNTQAQLQLQSQLQNQQKISTLTKQTQFLKQKIRSQQDLIDILTEQHNLLDLKLKQYKSSSNRNNGQSNPNYQKLNQQFSALMGRYQKMEQEWNRVVADLRAKEQELGVIKAKLQQVSSIYDSPIHKRALYQEESSAKKLEQVEKQFRSVKERLQSTQNRFRDQSRGWQRRQTQYLQQIKLLESQTSTLQQKLSTISNPPQNANPTDKYYLRIEGQKLQDLIKRIQNGSSFMSTKIDQILSNSRRSDTPSSGESPDMNLIISQNRILIQEIRKVLREKEQLSDVIRDAPNPEYINQFVFRIITYFAEIHPESPQARAVWQQLQRIRKQTTGEQYFLILQQFTKFTLQQCAIEVYRRQLQSKSIQLETLTKKLNTIIQQSLTSQRVLYEKTTLTESRVRMFTEKFVKLVGSNGNGNNRTHATHATHGSHGSHAHR